MRALLVLMALASSACCAGLKVKDAAAECSSGLVTCAENGECACVGDPHDDDGDDVSE